MSRALILRSRNDRWSVKLNTRVMVVTGVLTVLLAASSVLALTSGSIPPRLWRYSAHWSPRTSRSWH